MHSFEYVAHYFFFQEDTPPLMQQLDSKTIEEWIAMRMRMKSFDSKVRSTFYELDDSAKIGASASFVLNLSEIFIFKEINRLDLES